jgi:hypothetical protein
MNKFEITSSSEGFEHLREWWVSYDDSVITWKPMHPFLFAVDDIGQSIIDAVFAILKHHESDGETFIAAHPNVRLPATASNPHAALCVLNEVLPFESDDEDYFDDESAGTHKPPVVKYSRNAPRLIAIFGPSHDKFGNQIIY